jgi:CDP-diacylglycerol--glycerol-3-phosphate 3-phosphatidyltransferase
MRGHLDLSFNWDRASVFAGGGSLSGNFREHQELSLFDGRFRASVDRGVSPVGTALVRTKLSPDHLTALGLILAVPAAVVIGSGRLFWGLVLLIASAVPDLLDGALAKASGTASVRGAFFDSVADRVSDALILGGVAWYLQGRHHGHAALLPFAVLAVSMLISYERAKAESLGFNAKGGLMERAERIILICVGLAFSVVLVPVLWVMLVLSAITAVQRFVKVWRQASRPPKPQPVAMAERWRAWRVSNGWGEARTARRSGPRSNRFAQGTRRTGGTRWQERRLARLRQGSDPADRRRP